MARTNARLRAKIGDLERDKETLTEQKEALVRERDDLTGIVDQLVSETEPLRERNYFLNEQNEDLEDRITALGTQIGAMRQQIDSLRAERESLTDRNAILTSTNATLVSSLDQVERSNIALVERLPIFQNQFRELINSTHGTNESGSGDHIGSGISAASNGGPSLDKPVAPSEAQRNPVGNQAAHPNTTSRASSSAEVPIRTPPSNDPDAPLPVVDDSHSEVSRSPVPRPMRTLVKKPRLLLHPMILVLLYPFWTLPNPVLLQSSVCRPMGVLVLIRIQRPHRPCLVTEPKVINSVIWEPPLSIQGTEAMLNQATIQHLQTV